MQVQDVNSEVVARLNQRHRVDQAAEYAEVEAKVREEYRREDERVQRREAQAEAAVSAWAEATRASISVEFAGYRIAIRMNHQDRVIRDVARNAAHLLTQFVNRMIGEGATTAYTAGRADAFTMDLQWLDKLLSLDLQHAHARGLVTVTNLKTGKPVKLRAA